MRLRRDIDDLDDSLFEREDAQRRRDEREHERKLADERAVQMAAQDAILKTRSAAFMKDTGERMIRAEYRAAGLEPRPGLLVSLGMLLSIGWIIKEVGREKVLVAPPPPEKYVAKGECS